MNLSDLVHRTAGDNKVAATTSGSNSVNSKLSLLGNGNYNNNLFQQTIIDPSSSPSNLFSRQDQQLLFSMPNTDWMNNNIFNLNETLVDSVSNEVTANNNSNFYLKQDLMESSLQEQKTYQQKTTNSFKNQNIFRDFNISLPTTTTTTTLKSPPKDMTTLVEPSEENEPHNPIIMYEQQQQQETPIAPSNDVFNRLKTTTKVTGDNVTANNIEDGYIQFLLRHDPTYISDGIESLVYTKRKFQSVPKTGDIIYTTWDIYQLVLKLHRKEIKNWSQLVGQLGLADMAGRPQFAQRVKRWMHRLKIDSYFDYLLGNAYDFNGPPSTCLNIGNYKKRFKTDNKNEPSKDDSQTEEEEIEDDDDHRIPVLLAGSRKRMRDSSQNSTQMIENAQRYLQYKQDVASSGEEKEEEDDEDEEMTSVKERSSSSSTEEEEQAIEEEEEEEDELASSTSSPIISPTVIIPSPKRPSSPIKPPPKTLLPPPPPSSSSPLLLPSTFASLSTPNHICSNCALQTKKINHMEKEMQQLKLYITQLESQVEKQSHTMNKLLKEREHTERWRKQIISDLARGPTVVSDDDEDEEDDDDDDNTSDES